MNPQQGPPQPNPISDPLLVAIHATHEAIRQEQDPAAKATLGQCLTQMLKIQATEHQKLAQSGPNSPLLNRVAGGQNG